MLNLDAHLLQGELYQNASLSPYTSWRTGGNTEYLYLPKSADDLANLLKQLPKDVPLTYLGLGSNTLVRDGGVAGMVIITQGGLNQMTQASDGTIRAEAGVSCAQLARFTARLSKKGLEFMAGIPGTVGGALAMNAGCFGGETWTYVASVETIDKQGHIRKRAASDFQVSYREVIRPPGEFFIAGNFVLNNGNKAASLEEIRCLLEKRNKSQPTGIANCGSVFRNPSGDFAGRLIESCGLKGLKLGGATVSEKHANFILNEANATAADIESLIETVKERVFKQTGVLLKQEVCIIGKR